MVGSAQPQIPSDASIDDPGSVIPVYARHHPYQPFFVGYRRWWKSTEVIERGESLGQAEPGINVLDVKVAKYPNCGGPKHLACTD